jgi:transposase
MLTHAFSADSLSHSLWHYAYRSSLPNEALSLAKTTIQHFTSQLEAVDQAIAETIDNDVELSAKRDLLVSINGVGEALAGIVLAELPGPDILGCGAAVAAYAGLNPQQHQSGISVNRPVRISKIGNAVLRTARFIDNFLRFRIRPEEL